ncbi:hypothetical protein [Prosthecobacter sp.]|uniref:hypothetical protein n=1 Tax=Prosthecobacter sp. TaxID=1965333 RepID=UPI002AB8CD4D|nr:hypothetical protein [Prosthecobacter sp.]MDZ4402465.1 hypothetical protein [Prosthecobacter sp.]
MKMTLCMALIVNSAFYLLQHLCRIYFIMMEPMVAYAFPQNGPDWFVPYTLGFAGVAAGLLLWTAFLPSGRFPSSRIGHMIITVMAALNLTLAVGTHGVLVMLSERDFAETPLNKALRAKHARHVGPNSYRNP